MKHKSFTDKGEVEAFIARFNKTTTEEVNDEETNNEEEKEEQPNYQMKNEEKIIDHEGETGDGTEENYCLLDCEFEGCYIAGQKTISCDLCNDWYHLQCIKLGKQQAKELSAWICILCKDTLRSYRTKIKNLKTAVKNGKKRGTQK